MTSSIKKIEVEKVLKIAVQDDSYVELVKYLVKDKEVGITKAVSLEASAKCFFKRNKQVREFIIQQKEAEIHRMGKHNFDKEEMLTIVQFAVGLKNHEFTKLLLDTAANCTDEYRKELLSEALLKIVTTGCKHACEILLKLGAQPDVIPVGCEHSPLIEALSLVQPFHVKYTKAPEKFIEVCKLLCEHLQNPKDERIHLNFALRYNKIPDIIFTLAQKCPTELINKEIDEYTALELAIKHSSPLEVVKYLVEKKKANISQKIFSVITDLRDTDYKTNVNRYIHLRLMNQ